MAYNLFIAYDLMSPGQNYDAVRERIRSLGRWYQFQYSLFYVKTELSVQDAHAVIRQAMDLDDKLVVIDANSAFVSTYPKPDIEAVKFEWFTP
ncbi:MAG: hypothetical protein HY765_01115 [Rhodomicrobium sp.]|nr:hypothetical protein [Rhodomicrobium sp.]